MREELPELKEITEAELRARDLQGLYALSVTRIDALVAHVRALEDTVKRHALDIYTVPTISVSPNTAIREDVRVYGTSIDSPKERLYTLAELREKYEEWASLPVEAVVGCEYLHEGGRDFLRWLEKEANGGK